MPKTIKAVALAIGAATLAGCAALSVTGGQGEAARASSPMMARLWELQVDPAHLDAFRAIGVENITASTRREPGVLMMHAVQLADDPAQVRVLEVYANQDAYQKHIETPHFLKYRAASAGMVRSQRLVPVNPVLLCAKGGAIAPDVAQGAMVRMAVLKIDLAQLDAYIAFLTEEQEASVRLEPGVLMLHSVQYADDPTQIRLLEVYASREAYQSHIKSPHFLKYKNGTEKMVKSLDLVSTKPIMLAAQSRSLEEAPFSCL